MLKRSKRARVVARLTMIISGMIMCIFLFSTLTLAEPDYFSPKTWDGIMKEDNGPDLNGYPMVFVYGIAGKFSHWERTIKTIGGPNYYNIGFLPSGKLYHNYHGGRPNIWLWNASYYTREIVTESMRGDLTLYALRLQEMIEVIKEITKKDKVVIIAHSMGGLVARKYMALNQANWDSVYKILTVATPHQGVATSIGVVGQLADLKRNSKFISSLNAAWSRLDTGESKWGVIGAIDHKMFFNHKVSPDNTDSSGPGFIAISSAIPFGEWKDAVSHLNRIAYHTTHFAFRLAVYAKHMKLLYHKATFEGIYWAVKK